MGESHRSTARLAILDPVTFAEEAVFSGAGAYAVSGAVNMARGRGIRRTCSVSVANPDGAFTPEGVGDWFHVNSLVRLDRGIYLDAEEVEWVTLGHYLLGRPRVVVTAAGSTLEVQGEDRAKLLTRSRFTGPTTYAAGARIAAIVQAEAQIAGMGSTRYRLDDLGKTLAAARTFEEDEVRIDALGGMCRDYGLDLFVDADGFLATSEPPDPLTAPVAATYAAGVDATMVGLTKEWTDDRLYNHVLVTGEGSDPAHPPVRAEAMDTNPSSPAYINGPLGDRLYRYTSAMITSTAQAQEVANNLLPTVALVEEAISLDAVANPALEPGDAIQVSEPASNTAGRYLVDQVDIPLGPGIQSLQTRVARALA